MVINLISLDLSIIFNSHWVYNIVCQATGNLTEVLEFCYPRPDYMKHTELFSTTDSKDITEAAY